MEDFSDSPIEWESELYEDHHQNEKWTLKHNIMLLIDASESMFNTFGNSTFFSTSVNICKTIVMKLIRKGGNDKIGIMLFGTNDINKNGPNCIKIISEPRKPTIEFIKKLDDLMSANKTRYGQSPHTPLADALWYSNYLIKKIKESQSCSTIMIITCNDQPKVGDSKKQFNLRKRLDDIVFNEIDFKLIPIGANFNMKLFYDDFFKNYDSIIKPTNGLENVDDILSEIYEKIKHGRCISSVHFFLNDNIYFGVSLFNFYTKSKIPAKVRLDRRSNKPLLSNNQVLDIDTKEVIYKSELAKYCLISQQKIIFKNEDISVLKSSIIEPGIRLLGFTKKEKILISYHFKTSTFIRPSNKVVESSSVLFNTLLESLIEMNKIILCFIKVRHGGRLHYAALIPQAEIVDEHGTQRYPSGFHVLYLPFSECIRQINIQLHNDVNITEQQMSIANMLCEKMSINYCPAMIKNPKINFHWAMLEAIALELEIPNVLDETMLANDSNENKLCTLKNQIHEQFFPNGYNETKAISKKRETSSYNAKKVTKKIKK
ncbi:Ku70/Ku80, N-terminal alpha/beta,SPOC-like, C-terminal domain,Ku70, bridge and pillars domain,Ku70/Ku80 [Cinara cedri]|uniref:Ku70/Ku80, N-terminal alpha/beta,SPOC-like, C-terminal domain,Ku70, bridge and pillars domain,Ku70/Ku80 n=1 Tax=Cinara cedri TaxID=506608 RepID=A0A5E4MU79_9HEMI|nr:Ku70/Ku80, N-terminal alpha/beta,SPOC-like, C-terminal domain,Ku70, bridge and pillars domain,Ku70/Ku80 [Cinara cedri]